MFALSIHCHTIQHATMPWFYRLKYNYISSLILWFDEHTIHVRADARKFRLQALGDDYF